MLDGISPAQPHRLAPQGRPVRRSNSATVFHRRVNCDDLFGVRQLHRELRWMSGGTPMGGFEPIYEPPRGCVAEMQGSRHIPNCASDRKAEVVHGDETDSNSHYLVPCRVAPAAAALARELCDRAEGASGPVYAEVIYKEPHHSEPCGPTHFDITKQSHADAPPSLPPRNLPKGDVARRLVTATHTLKSILRYRDAFRTPSSKHVTWARDVGVGTDTAASSPLSASAATPARQEDGMRADRIAEPASRSSRDAVAARQAGLLDADWPAILASRRPARSEIREASRLLAEMHGYLLDEAVCAGRARGSNGILMRRGSSRW